MYVESIQHGTVIDKTGTNVVINDVDMSSSPWIEEAAGAGVSHTFSVGALVIIYTAAGAPLLMYM